MQIVEKLSRQQKKALGIVLTGNFLEYFDLMLFSHLAFVVTPYFMPKTDPNVAKLLGIFAFSSSFIIRPFAAMFWGYIGDNFGRIVVLSYTTLIMAVTCFFIPNIPSYEEIGIYSTFFIVLCRILQGFSSAGEAKGAEIFVAELVPKYPKIFTASIMVPITCDLGGLFATLLGAFCLSIAPEDGWKICFYIGSGIAFCSSITRKKLKETKDFILYSTRKNQKVIKPQHEYFEKRNFFALIGLNMICPTAFYFAYSFGSDLLKDIGVASNKILLSNSMLLLFEIIFLLLCARLTYRFHPFHILKIRTQVSLVLMPLAFLMMYLVPSHASIFITQLIVLLSTASFDPATPLVIRSFAIQSRFTRYSKAWALAKALMYLSTGYLTHYMNTLFGIWGVLGLLIFFSTIFGISLYFFVPYNDMEARYKNEVLFGNKEYFIPKAAVNDSEDSQDQYHKTYLKNWIDK